MRETQEIFNLDGLATLNEEEYDYWRDMLAMGEITQREFDAKMRAGARQEFRARLRRPARQDAQNRRVLMSDAMLRKMLYDLAKDTGGYVDIAGITFKGEHFTVPCSKKLLQAVEKWQNLQRKINGSLFRKNGFPGKLDCQLAIESGHFFRSGYLVEQAYKPKSINESLEDLNWFKLETAQHLI